MGRLTRYFWVMWAAFIVRWLGMFWDARWHRLHGAMESTTVLSAHGPMLAGTLVLLVTTVLAFRQFRSMGAGVYGFFLTLAATTVQILGQLWDTGVHTGWLPGSHLIAHRLWYYSWYAMVAGIAAATAPYVLSLDSKPKAQG